MVLSGQGPLANRLTRRRFGLGLAGAGVGAVACRQTWRTAAQDQSGDPPFDPASFGLSLSLVVEGLTRPVHFVDLNDGSGRFLIVEQGGQVKVLKESALVERPFLDIGDELCSSNEEGLLSLACDPAFAENGLFYIYFTNLDSNCVVERWRVGDNPDRANPDTREEILLVEHPNWNHNGGLLVFGPDGYLYVSIGDGGGGASENAQDFQKLLGAILRIDVSQSEGDLAYAIPPDNPFVGRDDARSELFCKGLRNPWRYSIDRATGDLYIGDVGSGTEEEIDLIPAGQSGLNFGWPIFEGTTCFDGECDDTDLTPPIYSYFHADGACVVTGGFVYRGERIPELRGTYLFADYCTGLLWGMGRDANGSWTISAPIETGLSISSFAEDAAGELYVCDLAGAIYKIEAP